MGTYYVGDGDQHRVDHPPLFACREHKALLTLSGRFVMELLASAQDVMPGNPAEIASSYLKAAQPAYTLPGFLIPPKIVLFNPRGLRGAEALPYCFVLIDKKFFGIPARYLTPDRFDGCEVCRHLKPRRSAPRGRGGPPGSGVRRPPRPSDSGAIRRVPPSHESGVRRAPPRRRPDSQG